MPTTLVRWKDARNPAITDTIEVDGVALNLTGATVKFKMREIGSSTLKVDASATIVSAAAGTVSYAPAAADVDTSSLYMGWWEVTSGGLTQDTGEFIVDIRDHAAESKWLCDVGDIRLALELQHGEDARLSTAEELILPASLKVMEWCQREFAPATADATRTFDVQFGSRGPFLELAPYDLRTVAAILLHPEESSPTTLTVGEDYRLEPVAAQHGTYTRVKLYPGLGYSSTLQERLGATQVSVQGAWGFATIPEQVRRATALTVSAWLDRPIAEYGSFVDDDVSGLTPSPATSLGLPNAAKRLVDEFKRHAVPV